MRDSFDQEIIDKRTAEIERLRKDLAEAVRLLDALLGLEMDSGGEALAFIERYNGVVGKARDA